MGKRSQFRLPRLAAEGGIPNWAEVATLRHVGSVPRGLTELDWGKIQLSQLRTKEGGLRVGTQVATAATSAVPGTHHQLRRGGQTLPHQ